jgi:hypothetical protein
MAMAATGNGEFNIGRVVSRTFETVGRNSVTFLVLALIATLPSIFVSYLASAQTLNSATPFSGSSLGITFASSILGIVLSFLLQAAITYATVMDLNGRRASFGEALSTGLRSIGPLFVIGIVYSIGVGLSLLLLLFPGFMLLTAWAVVVPSRVIENTPIMESFSRSSALTKGHRWPIFGIYVVFYLAVGAIEYAARPFFGLTMTSNLALSPGYFVVLAIVGTLTAVIAATGTACIYYELRSAKEGIGPEHLAAVFE